MKKLLLIIFSLITALIITELAVKYLIRYPVYGVEKSILGIPYRGKEYIYKPYSKYWNVEGGNNIYSRNNIGLNGIDINININQKNIFVLGNSFVKAAEIQPESIATSVLQSTLNKNNHNYSVLNLGFYSHDPYQLWFLSHYFAKYYTPSAVILVLERDYEFWLKEYRHPLEFGIPDNFGIEENGLLFKVFTSARNHSSLINLLAGALKLSGGNGGLNQNEKQLLMSGNLQFLPDDLKTVIIEYHKVYGDKFVVLSIMPDENINLQLAEFCRNSNVNCMYDENIMIPQNRLNKNGHLNITGNEKLGEKLYDAFEKFIQPD